MEFVEDLISRWLWLSVGSFLFVFGTVGNIVSLIVLNAEFEQKTSTIILLSALAVTDMGTIVIAISRHLMREIFQIRIRELHEYMCKLHVYFTYLFVHLSSWILVLVTIERALSVWKPLIVKKICNVRSSYVVLTVTVVINLCWDLHVAVHSGLVGYSSNSTHDVVYYCDLPKDTSNEVYMFFINDVWPYIDPWFKFVVPFFILLVCNIIIIVKTRRSQRFLQNSNMRGKRDSSQLRLNVTIVLLSVAFLLLNAPMNVFKAVYPTVYPLELLSVDRQKLAEYIMCLTILNLLSYFNNAINFIFYVLCGNRFRQRTKHILCFCLRFGRRSRQDLQQINRKQPNSELMTVSQTISTTDQGVD